MLTVCREWRQALGSAVSEMVEPPDLMDWWDKHPARGPEDSHGQEASQQCQEDVATARFADENNLHKDRARQVLLTPGPRV